MASLAAVHCIETVLAAPLCARLLSCFPCRHQHLTTLMGCGWRTTTRFATLQVVHAAPLWRSQRCWVLTTPRCCALHHSVSLVYFVLFFSFTASPFVGIVTPPVMVVHYFLEWLKKIIRQKICISSLQKHYCKKKPQKICFYTNI